MRRRWTVLGLAVLAACGGERAQCVTTGECLTGLTCVSGMCVGGDDPGAPLDAGVMGRDGPLLVLLEGGVDAARPDARAMDGSAPRDSGIGMDAGLPRDSGLVPNADAQVNADAQQPNADAPASLDAQPSPDARPSPDAQPAPDAQAPRDAGFPAGPVSPGVYQYRRVLLQGLASNRQLVTLAISPDSHHLIVGERNDVLRAVDIPAETSTITVTLPKDRGEPISIYSIAYTRGGESVLIAATAALSGSAVEGRLYLAGPRLEGLTELTALRANGTTFQSLAVDPRSGEIQLLGSRPSGAGFIVQLSTFDPVMRRLTNLRADVRLVEASDLAIADDGIGGRARVFVGSRNGGLAGHLDGTGAFYYAQNVSNTSRVAARPQGDYALAIAGFARRLYRFDLGVWTSQDAPMLPYSNMWNVTFNDDGTRALITGGAQSGAMTMLEFRHDLYDEADITDVSIPAFNAAPWLGRDGVTMWDAAFRPGGDCGYAVGGCSTVTGCTLGYLVAFTVANGRPCPP